MAKCDICKEEHSEETQSCNACNKVIIKYQGDTRYSMTEVRTALSGAYSGKDNNESQFRCAYTGIISKFNNKDGTLGMFKDAFILTLDHKNPPEKELVVALNIINKMKGDIPSEKFKNTIISLGAYLKKEVDNEEIERQLKQILE